MHVAFNISFWKKLYLLDSWVSIFDKRLIRRSTEKPAVSMTDKNETIFAGLANTLLHDITADWILFSHLKTSCLTLIIIVNMRYKFPMIFSMLLWIFRTQYSLICFCNLRFVYKKKFWTWSLFQVQKSEIGPKYKFYMSICYKMS